MGLVRGLLRRLGYDLQPYPHFPPDVTPADRAILAQVLPFTMTGVERILAMIEAVRYVTKYHLPGSIVECGVWRGGSMMAAAHVLLNGGDTERDLFLYDTFEGMTAPGQQDRDFQGRPAQEQFPKEADPQGQWCASPLEEVRANLRSTGYPDKRLHFVQGKVEETLPATLPGPIALLRLDTDWYESTRHELEHLYPLVASHGVIIVDDYGHWQGSRQATDEFLARLGKPTFLHRIDFTGRAWIKGAS